MSSSSVMAMGTRIREARHSARMTQAALARATGVSERNIVRWENDQHSPRSEHVAAIAEATGKDTGFFFASSEEDAEDRSLLGSVLSRDEYALYGVLTARIVAAQQQVRV